jgi:hypothetical protein
MTPTNKMPQIRFAAFYFERPNKKYVKDVETY